MEIHEYQAKKLLEGYGVPVPEGQVAYSVTEAEAIAQRFKSWPLMIKAQVHSGGRGKAGGIRKAQTMADLRNAAMGLMGRTLVTAQSGPGGKKIGKIYIEKASDIARELYISILVNRQTSGTTVIASAEGGMDIEELAASRPEKIVTLNLKPGLVLRSFHARQLASKLGFTGQELHDAVSFIRGLYNCFARHDALMVEVNPWAVTGDGRMLALDAKMSFDPNAMFRQRPIEDLRDVEQEDPLEVEAGRHSLNYVKLDGNIGCMVNGAGLAMATLDIIALKGGKPANFMDVAGAATPERIAAALTLIHNDENVKVMLVNIFGGMMRCDSIAKGLVLASKELRLAKPLVVRLEGTNVEAGRRILQQEGAGLPIVIAEDLDAAAEAAVRKVAEGV